MKAWHWVADNRKLRDGQELVDGKTYTHDGPLVMCESGLHASEKILDALRYAPGPVLCRVECGGRIVTDTDKFICRERTVLWSFDATNLLHEFARWCALQVIDKWDAPDVVRRYLETGDESIRDAAWVAAWDATWDAAWVAARVAARDAARDAARAAAGDAARAAAGDAAGDAARAAAGDAQNKKLEEMVTAARAALESEEG
jgi:hypothetical protein